MTQPTEPNLRKVNTSNQVEGPPRILFWGVIGFFLLIVLGLLSGFFVLNQVFTSGQQARVVGEFPFMEAFLIRQPTPAGGLLPTAEVMTESEVDLLNLNLSIATEEPDVATEEPFVPTEPANEMVQPTELLASATPLPTITPSVTPTQTPLPTRTNTPQASNNASSVELAALPMAGGPVLPTTSRLYGFTWDRQTWNNCGPATITLALTHFGWQEDQEYARDILRPGGDDKNVTPQELVRFVNDETGVRAVTRMGGDIDLLRRLLAAEFPVIIERGIRFESYDWIGHYQTLVAYDDSLQAFFAYDTYLGTGAADEGVIEYYSALDADWRAFNRQFIVVYPPDRDGEVRAILGERWNERTAARQAFEVAQDEVAADQTDGIGYHNMGMALVALGQYAEAANAFDVARRLGIPWRMMWYQFGAYEAYYAVGRHRDVISLADATLNQSNTLEESYYWRGRAYAALGETARAASDFRRALTLNRNFTQASRALSEL